MNLKNKIFFILFCLSLLWESCQCNQAKDKHFDIPETESAVIVKSIRLDSIVFHSPFINAQQYQENLIQTSQNSICPLVEDILRMGPCEDSSTFRQLHQFTIFKDIADLQGAVEDKFSTIQIQEFNHTLSEAFTRLKVILPQEVIPQIVYTNSGLAAASYAQNEQLFIGLDSYLYPHPIVKEFPTDRFPLYKRKNMQAQYLVPNAIFNWMSYRYTAYDSLPPEKNDFLSSLIYSGKLMYATDLLIPELADSLKMMWSEDEMLWAKEHEFQIWKEIARQEVMFGTNRNEILKWFNEAPHTFAGNIPSDSPAQLGIWMGWQIVKAYMSKNENISLAALFQERNHQKILSAYKPPLP